MCGIVAYIGPREAYPVIMKGLKRLEYRGYDSAGVALLDKHNLRVFKKQGRVAVLEESIIGKDLHAHAGIGHTRWATHGEPSDRNAHPHLSASGRLAMIHNGIIENYAQLKTELTKKGYHFKSDTDTEVLLNFIEDIQENNQCSLEESIRIALKRVTGAYVIVLLDRESPGYPYCRPQRQSPGYRYRQRRTFSGFRCIPHHRIHQGSRLCKRL